MSRNTRALIAGAIGGYFNALGERDFEQEEWEETQRKLTKQYGIVPEQPPIEQTSEQEMMEGGGGFAGTPPQTVADHAPSQGIIGRAAGVQTRDPNAMPGRGQAGADTQSPSAQTSTGSEARGTPPDYTGYYNALARKAIEMGRTEDAVTMLRMDEHFRSQLYRDSLRKARPLMLNWIMGGDVDSLEQAMNSVFPDGHEYEVTANDDGTYQVSIDGKVFSKSMTKDQLSQQAAFALQNEDNYVQSLISSIQSKLERKQELADKEREHQRNLEKEKRKHELALEKERLKAKLRKPPGEYVTGADGRRYRIRGTEAVPVSTSGGQPLNVEEGNSLTEAQRANNAEIDAARQALEGMSRDEILRRSRKQSDTGRVNEDYDPYIEALLRKATQRKVGQDDRFESFYAKFYGVSGGGPKKSPSEMTDAELLQHLGFTSDVVTD